MKATDKNYTKYIQYYSDFVPRILVELTKKQAVRSLLDLGCGDGAILFALKKQNLLKGKRVFAIDISRERIAKTQKIDKNFQCFVADACDLGGVIKKNSLDLVISSQVIEHVKDPERLIYQAKQILKSGGYFYLSTAFKKRYGWFFYKNDKKEWVLDPTHLREYRHDDELIPLLEKAEFRLIHNQKILWKFPIADFFLKRLGFKSDIYQKNRALKMLRLIKIPILGYYYWELVFRKNN